MISVGECDSLTLKLANRISALRYEHLPHAVVGKAIGLIVDTVAVAAGGASAAGVKNVADLMIGEGGRPEAKLWTTGNSLPATSTAFVNSLHAVALDYDSLNGTVHADAVVLPAAAAIAERQRSTGQEFLTAYVIGTEVMARLASSVSGPSPGWSHTAIFGGFGAAAAAAYLLKLDPQQTAHALGLALGQAAGTQQANVEQVLQKRLQPALACRAGVFSALLAKAGITAPKFAVEGKFGFGKLYRELDESHVLGGFGEEFFLMRTGLKKYPICACSHTPVEALHDTILAHGLTAADIMHIEARISPFMARLVGGEGRPAGDLEVFAQFNLRYAIASMALRNRIGLAELSNQSVTETAMIEFMKRITITVDPQSSGELAPASVIVTCTNNEVFRTTCNTMPGTPEAPIDAHALRLKHSECLKESSVEVLIRSVEHNRAPDIVFQGFALNPETPMFRDPNFGL
ncbi:MmgE/PrpD family protein [Rhizobium rhizogenes]|uniref:MmgE/PrpD family protein n=1 Tax=Rhizobium rhizogenes TaxID=359 RepID=UPI0015735FC6|nr:MmgE/PrpD family protein [Rhizobium rhizogenes]NTF96082.1 MmgE/PrpD family protein [Rhizobium rhizogenes]